MEMNEIIAQLKSLNEQANETIASMKEKTKVAYEEYESELYNRLMNIYRELEPVLLSIDGNEERYIVHKYKTKDKVDTFALVFRKNGVYVYKADSIYDCYSDLNLYFQLHKSFTQLKLADYINRSTWMSGMIKYIADNWEDIKDDVLKTFIKKYSENIEEKLKKETKMFNEQKAQYTFKERM